MSSNVVVYNLQGSAQEQWEHWGRTTSLSGASTNHTGSKGGKWALTVIRQRYLQAQGLARAEVSLDVEQKHKQSVIRFTLSGTKCAPCNPLRPPG